MVLVVEHNLLKGQMRHYFIITLTRVKRRVGLFVKRQVAKSNWQFMFIQQQIFTVEVFYFDLRVDYLCVLFEIQV